LPEPGSWVGLVAAVFSPPHLREIVLPLGSGRPELHEMPG
jgi:hypothetical protein